eukprot:CAMPEP_0175215288 /NCGR_PEP_ID=MMETSP0093-20121207/17140_1 /TAXON_ID=311494 /ORGANISM="Alexandrium monilatum, Strain CCMP3105" /LENGTH=374 /DNA_ID=CAMNT_0016508657 /DNA_START=187 /DNA_END=1310 /DNA_ORIENTATION=+
MGGPITSRRCAVTVSAAEACASSTHMPKMRVEEASARASTLLVKHRIVDFAQARVPLVKEDRRSGNCPLEPVLECVQLCRKVRGAVRLQALYRRVLVGQAANAPPRHGTRRGAVGCSARCLQAWRCTHIPQLAILVRTVREGGIFGDPSLCIQGSQLSLQGSDDVPQRLQLALQAAVAAVGSDHQTRKLEAVVGPRDALRTLVAVKAALAGQSSAAASRAAPSLEAWSLSPEAGASRGCSCPGLARSAGSSEDATRSPPGALAAEPPVDAAEPTAEGSCDAGTSSCLKGSSESGSTGAAAAAGRSAASSAAACTCTAAGGSPSPALAVPPACASSAPRPAGLAGSSGGAAASCSASRGAAPRAAAEGRSGGSPE